MVVYFLAGPDRSRTCTLIIWKNPRSGVNIWSFRCLAWVTPARKQRRSKVLMRSQARRVRSQRCRYHATKRRPYPTRKRRFFIVDSTKDLVYLFWTLISQRTFWTERREVQIFFSPLTVPVTPGSTTLRTKNYGKKFVQNITSGANTSPPRRTGSSTIYSAQTHSHKSGPSRLSSWRRKILLHDPRGFQLEVQLVQSKKQEDSLYSGTTYYPFTPRRFGLFEVVKKRSTVRWLPWHSLKVRRSILPLQGLNPTTSPLPRSFTLSFNSTPGPSSTFRLGSRSRHHKKWNSAFQPQTQRHKQLVVSPCLSLDRYRM